MRCQCWSNENPQSDLYRRKPVFPKRTRGQTKRQIDPNIIVLTNTIT